MAGSLESIKNSWKRKSLQRLCEILRIEHVSRPTLKQTDQLWGIKMTIDNMPKRIARSAGFLYPILIPIGIFGLVYVPSSLYIPGDMAATVNNIVDSESMFRLGMVSTFL